jgi:CDGSH-type Zn-finger protein
MTENTAESSAAITGPKITITLNGPYAVEGAISLSKQIIETDAEGQSRTWGRGESFEAGASYRLCRCGRSSNKPFCDSTHTKIGFDGTETASRAPYVEQVEVIEGPTMDLTDAESLCAFARFCDPDGRIWNLIEGTDDPDVVEKVKYESGHCPSGRLVVWDKATGQPYEPVFSPSIGLVEDPKLAVSGPLWVRGGITVYSADGKAYEVRNRMTLCRCGASSNKPFCDGSQASIGFADGL